MNEKTKKTFLICLIFLVVISLTLFISAFIEYLDVKDKNDNIDNNSNNITNNEYINNENEMDNNIISKTDNNIIITVDEDSSIRVINTYDENMFKGHKSLIFFWASWCSHCQEEYDVVKTAVEDYQNKGYTIYVISHDYEIDELNDFMKNNDFNYEVYFDETRIIRKNINPEASSVPLTYILNEDAKLIDFHDGAITLEELNNLMDKNK